MINYLANVNAYLYSIEALMEPIFDIKVPEDVELKFKKISKKLYPNRPNVDRLIHQTPDLPDKRILSSHFFNITCNFNWHR